MRSSTSVIALCAALMLAGTTVALAQDAPPLPPLPEEGAPDAVLDAPAPAPALAPAQANAEGQGINQILVEGVLRVEPNTVLSYITLRPGGVYTAAEANMALRTLFGTGLFSDVELTMRPDGVLVVRVEESPIINRVLFEGNSALRTNALTDEIEVAPRSVFTEARVQADAQRIIELYRRSGRFAATVTPTIVELDQNRVDLIFEISEGQITGVRRINFLGNERFSDSRLRRVIATQESRFWRFFSSNTNYDPDRLEYDRELLREFYADRGYAQFRVTSAVAELTPDQRGFYINYTVEEGERFRYGDITVETEIGALDANFLQSLVPLRTGQDFVGSNIEASVDLLTFAAGTAGYAFVDIQPFTQINAANNTVDITFLIAEGPRVYVERIDILGNTRTLDRVIRREMQVVEGDAFNRVLLDRSRNRIRALGFFEDVTIEEVRGSRADTAAVQVSVTEQPTGELSFGAGYSSLDAFLIDLSITERNLRGRGQFLRLSLQTSARRSMLDLRFTEPRFLDRNLSAGFELFRWQTDFAREAGFESTSLGGRLRMAFPISDSASLGLNYTLRTDRVRAFQGASAQVRGASGEFLTSLVGFQLGWDRRNDPIFPTRGFDVQLIQDFAGIGGDVQFLRTETRGNVYRGIIGSVVASFAFDAGYITGWGGDDVRLNDRYFKGGYTFRGFRTAGLGPRTVQEVTDTDGNVTRIPLDALGGKLYAIGALELSFPLGLPEQYGLRGGLFTEFGTVGVLDDSVGAFTVPGSNIIVEDDLALRASAGVSIFWDSPFGPVRFDFSSVLLRQDYDRTETFRFSQMTRF